MLTGQHVTVLESWPDDAVLPFEFLIEGPPVSQQTRRRQDGLHHWRATVLAAIRKASETAEDPRGPIKLDEHNDPTQNVYILKVEKVGGFARRLWARAADSASVLAGSWHMIER